MRIILDESIPFSGNVTPQIMFRFKHWFGSRDFSIHVEYKHRFRLFAYGSSFFFVFGNMVFSGTVEEFDNYIQPNTLVVSLGALPLVADIQALPGVVRVEELGGPRFRIQFSDVKEAINSIVEASYTRDWQLMELQQEKSSLDTIFAELSKK